MNREKVLARSIKESKYMHTLFTIIMSIVIGGVLTLAFYYIEKRLGYSVLAEYDENGVVNGGLYLEFVAISFSVTFLTTSLLGGLSDKTEKIYWITYPDEYLIKSVLNFFNLSMVSYISIVVQVVFALIKCNVFIKDGIFMAAFIIGTASIIMLSYKFTSIYFNRERIRKKAEKKFIKWIEDLEKARENGKDNADELEEEITVALMKIYNYTFNATEEAKLNIVCENIQLLYIVSEKNKECNEWFERLVRNLASENEDIFHQVILCIYHEIMDKNKFSGCIINCVDYEVASANIRGILAGFMEKIVCEYVREVNEYNEINNWIIKESNIKDKYTASRKRISIELAEYLDSTLGGVSQQPELYTNKAYKSLIKYILLKTPDLICEECVKTVIINYWDSMLAYYCESIQMKRLKPIIKLSDFIFEIALEINDTYMVTCLSNELMTNTTIKDMKEHLNQKLVEMFDDKELLKYVIGILSKTQQQHRFCLYVGQLMVAGTMKNMIDIIDIKANGNRDWPIFNALIQRLRELEGESWSTFASENIKYYQEMIYDKKTGEFFTKFIQEILKDIKMNDKSNTYYYTIVELIKDDAEALCWYSGAFLFNKDYEEFFANQNTRAQFVIDTREFLNQLFDDIESENIENDIASSMATIIVNILITSRGILNENNTDIYYERFVNWVNKNKDSLGKIIECLQKARRELEEREIEGENLHDYETNIECNKMVWDIIEKYESCINRVDGIFNTAND